MLGAEQLIWVSNSSPFFQDFSLFLSVGTIETISRQSLVYRLCFSLVIPLVPSPGIRGQHFLRRSALFRLLGPGRTLEGSVGK